MTKSPKIALRKETLRLLSNKELVFAVGGGNTSALMAETANQACPLVASPTK
jgi:peptidase E